MEKRKRIKKKMLNIEKELQEVLLVAESETKSWIIKTLPNIKERIHSSLDKKVDEIILKTMGLTNHWGSWEVDHCNGRSGNSTVGDWIKGSAEFEVKQWFLKHVNNLPEIPPKAIESIKKDYLEELNRAIRNRLRERIDQESKRMVDVLIDKMIYGEKEVTDE